MWLQLFTLVLANNHLERCKATINPSIQQCNDDHNCKCNVLARQGAKCLRSAPAGSLVDLIRSVDDGACIKTHFMDLSVIDNVKNFDNSDSTMNMDEFYKLTNTTSPEVLAEIYDKEDVRDEQLATKFAEWIDDRMGVVYNREKQDKSPAGASSVLMKVVVETIKRVKFALVEQL